MIGSAQRYARAHPCPICGGYEGTTRGLGRTGNRCTGFLASDSPAAFCGQVESREWRDGPGGAGAGYLHRLDASCPCGQEHGSATGGTTWQPRAPEPEREMLDADTADRINRRILELCPLRDEHRDYLRGRSTAPADLDAADRFGYGSLPAAGREVREVVATLTAEFGHETLAHAAGFFLRNGRLSMHSANNDYDAIIIPGFDTAGRITNFVRMKTRGDESHAKYRQFYGTHGAFTVAGEYRKSGRREVRVTEGWHKPFVASVLDPGVVYVGLPGTALHSGALAAITELAPDVVVECLDGDKRTKPEVARAQATIHARLLAAGFTVEESVWDEADGKGADDVLAAGGCIRLRPVGGHTAPEDDESSPCAEQAAHIERLQDLVAELRTELAHVKALQTHQWRLLRKDELRASERIVIAAAVQCVGEATAHAGASAAARVPLARVAEQAGVSVKTAGRTVANAVTWGLLRKEVHKGEGAPYPFRNRLTGVVEERFGDAIYLSLTQPEIQTLEAAVALELEDRPQQGGRKTRLPLCPHCGSPLAHFCTGCGTVFPIENEPEETRRPAVDKLSRAGKGVLPPPPPLVVREERLSRAGRTQCPKACTAVN